jgi:hypothetical protein
MSLKKETEGLWQEGHTPLSSVSPARCFLIFPQGSIGGRHGL